MKNYTHIIRKAMIGLSLCGALAIGGALQSASAQDQNTDTTPAPAKQKTAGGRDPFRPYTPPKAPRKVVPLPIDPPSIQSRIERYKAQKLAAMNAQLPAPKPTTALLLSEVQVIGIFHTPRGYAAMVEATPIKLSYVIYPGEQLYDGQLVAIEENRLVFRRETRLTDGKVVRTVENKPLRQPDAVSDSLAAPKETTSTTPAVNTGSSASSGTTDGKTQTPAPAKP